MSCMPNMPDRTSPPLSPKFNVFTNARVTEAGAYIILFAWALVLRCGLLGAQPLSDSVALSLLVAVLPFSKA